MKRSRLNAVACVVALNCCISATPAVEWRTYHQEALDYRIEYPAGWQVVPADAGTSGPVGLHGVAFHEPDGGAWPGEFVITVHENAESAALEQWADATFTDVHDESLVIHVEEASLAARPAKRFYVFGFDHTAVVVALIHQGKIFTVGYTGSNPNDADVTRHASIYARMEASLRFGAPTAAEIGLLGGPCAAAARSSPPGFHAELRRAAAAGDHARQIELQRHYVRAMCSNHFRWFALAETHAAAGHAARAIAVLHEAHRRGAEIKSSTLRHQPTLLDLIETVEFRQTPLGRELDALRAAAAARRESFAARLAAADPASRPPQRHVAHGACPFECCTYREWDVLETTPLYDAPSGTVRVGTATRGSRVSGVTGEVHLRPMPVAVVHERPPFARGEILYVLDYLGEGSYRYWRDGVIDVGDLRIDESCLRPSRDCWLEYVERAELRQEPRWWVLIETGEGVRGWTDRPDLFGNKDACG